MISINAKNFFSTSVVTIAPRGAADVVDVDNVCTQTGTLGGLAQINAIVPPTVAAGQPVPITIVGGSAQTARQGQTGVALAVK